MTFEYCGQEIIQPVRGQQRFCCETCSDEWFAAERREAVEWFRACGMRPTVRRDEQQGQGR
jgi:hypothetical protein